MPFGLHNAPATFQRFMDAVLGDAARKWCEPFFDDVIIYSETMEDHLEHLEEMWALLGAKPKYTTAYHQQTNLTERINKTLVSCQRTFTEQHQHWDSGLPELEFAINTAQQESTGFAPCQLVFGRMLQFPWKMDEAKVDELILPNDDDLKDFATNLLNRLAKAFQFVRDNLDKAATKQKKHYAKYRSN